MALIEKITHNRQELEDVVFSHKNNTVRNTSGQLLSLPYFPQDATTNVHVSRALIIAHIADTREKLSTQKDINNTKSFHLGCLGTVL